MSEERIATLEAAVLALHERMALAEAALVRTHEVLAKLTELVDALHRRLSHFRGALGPQPPLSGAN